MFTTKLPDPKNYSYETPILETNSIIYSKTSDKYYYPPHKTPFMFVGNFMNEGYYVLNNRYLKISDKYFYFLNINDQLEINFNTPQPLQTLFILFSEKYIIECFNFHSSSDEQLLELSLNKENCIFQTLSVPFPYNSKIRVVLNRVMQNIDNKETLDEFLFNFILEFVYMNSKTTKQLEQLQAVKKSTREELYRRLFLAKQFMADNVREKLTIDIIAKEICLNKFHFIKTFSELYNITPHQFIIELKLQKAYSLLKDKGCSVTEACYNVGFESIGTFSNAFKKRFKVPPIELLKTL